MRMAEWFILLHLFYYYVIDMASFRVSRLRTKAFVLLTFFTLPLVLYFRKK